MGVTLHLVTPNLLSFNKLYHNGIFLLYVLTLLELLLIFKISSLMSFQIHFFNDKCSHGTNNNY